MVFVELAKMRRVRSYLAAAGCIVLLSVTSAAAHPHMWVDLESRVVLNDKGQATEIQQVWLFDDFFSTAVIEDADLHPDGASAGIQEEIDRIVNTLKPYNYFTLIKHGARTLPLTFVGDVSWEVIENRIQMTFTVSIDNYIEVETQNFSYAIFDPTYYVEMAHLEGATIKIEGEAAEDCNSWIEQPNPSSDAIALSQSTTLDSDPDETVGRLFAETVHVNCG
jgi:ABC-type uncharacterized transport system substrate-binding protein